MEKKKDALARTLSFWDLFSLGVASLIGTGIFVMTGIAAGPAGAGLFLAFIIAGLIAISTALSYAELSSMYPAAGASYVYCKNAFSTLNQEFGNFISAVVGWTLMTQYAAVGAAVWLGFGLYAQFFFPQLPMNIWAIILGVLTTALLYRGMNISKGVINFFTVFKVVALLIFIGIGLFNPQLPPPVQQVPFLPLGIGGLIAAAALIAFGQIHIDAVTTCAEEAIDPRKDVPRATVYSIALVVALYSLVGWVIVTLVPASTLPTLKAPLAAALEAVTSGWAPNFIAVAGIAATITSGIGCMIGGPRVGLAMAREGQLWSAFGKVHPQFRSPSMATIFCGIFAIALCVTGNLALVASAGVFTALVVFILVNGSVIILRFTQKDAHRNFTIPFGILIPLLSIIGIVIEISFLNPKAIMWGTLWMLSGVVIYFLFRKNTKVS